MIKFSTPEYMADVYINSRAYVERWQRSSMFRTWTIAKLCGQVGIGYRDWCFNVRKRPEVFL